MPAANEPIPRPEDEWFTRDPDEAIAPHERTISEARAVQEALARLGPSATDEALRRDLERVGVRLSPEWLAEIRAEMHPAGRAGAPAASPSDLVRTEGDTVPPPSTRQTGTTTAPVPARQESPPRPSDLVKTEGETVPPPRD
jgi:hypothetical protein